MTKSRIIFAFFCALGIVLSGTVMLLQSAFFANQAKKYARSHLPSDFGIDGDFSEVKMRLFPPGVSIKNPSLVLKEGNVVGLPSGTSLSAVSLDVTLQFFQLFTGRLRINAVTLNGAKLKLEIDEAFLRQNQKGAKDLSGDLSWSSLFRLDFRSASILDSFVDISVRGDEDRPDARVRAVTKELTVGRGTVESLPAYEISADFQNGEFELGKNTQHLDGLQTSIEVNSKGVNLRNLSLQEGQINFHTNGTIQGNILKPKSMKAKLSYILRGPIENWLSFDFVRKFLNVAKLPDLKAKITLEGAMTGDLISLKETLETKFQLAVEEAEGLGWALKKAAFEGTVNLSRVAVSRAEVNIGPGETGADGMVRLSSMSFDFRSALEKVQFEADLENVDLRRVLGPKVQNVKPLHMTLTGKLGGSLDFSREKPVIHAKANVDVQKFSFDKLLAVPKLHANSEVTIDDNGIKLGQTVVTIDKTKLSAGGKVDFKSGLDLLIQGPVNLQEVGKIGAFDIGGTGNLVWTIRGKIPDVIFSFQADLKDARYLDLNLGSAKGVVEYDDGKETLTFKDLAAEVDRTSVSARGFVKVDASDRIDIDIKMSRGTLQDFARIFSTFIQRSIPWYPKELMGQMKGDIKVSGQTGIKQLAIEGNMEISNAEYMGESIHYCKMLAGYRRGDFFAENINLQKKNGWVRGFLNYGANEEFKFDLKSDGLTTLDFNLFAALGVPYSAPVYLEAQGAGKFDALKANYRASVGAGRVKVFPVPGSDVAVKTEGNRWQISASLLGDKLKSEIDFGWKHGSDGTMSFEARDFDFRPILIALNTSMVDDPELVATLNGTSKLRFTTGQLSKLSGTVDFQGYKLKRHGYSLELAAPKRIEIQNGNYAFEHFTLKGRDSKNNPFTFNVDGRVRDGVIAYSGTGAIDLGILPFFVQEFGGVRGLAKIDGRLHGRAESPNVDAKVEVRGADLRLRAVENPFEDLGLEMQVHDSKFQVPRMEAKFAGGTVTGSGSGEIFLTKAPALDFRIQLNNPRIKVYPVAFARMNGSMNVVGAGLPYKVSGKLNIAEALVRENFSLSEGSRILRSSKFLPTAQGPSSSPSEITLFDMDLHLGAERNIFIRNDLFDAEVRGNLNVLGAMKTPRLLGGIQIINGKLLFKDNFFAIQSGQIRFANPSTLDPEFDLIGQTELKGYKVLLVAGGKVTDYRLNLSSHPPLAQPDIVNLLTLGVTSAEYQGLARENREAYSRDELYGLLFSQSGINKGLKDKFGVQVQVSQSQIANPSNVFRARSEDSQTIAPKVVLQKQITRKLKASVGSTVGVGDNQERSADLEYSLGRRWSVIGVYEDQRGARLRTSRTSMGADLKYQIRFK